MAIHYVPFQVTVYPKSGDIYPVRTEFRGSTALGELPAALPMLQADELQQAQEWLRRGFVDTEYTADLGGRLFQMLFSGSLCDAFRAAYATVEHEEAALRIILTLPDELSTLPWELMFDAQGVHGFLARSKSATLVRHFDGLPIPSTPSKQGPLRILVVTASPSDAPPVSATLEATTIRSILSGRSSNLIHTLQLLRRRFSLPSSGEATIELKQLVDVDVLCNASRRTLQQKLDSAQGYDVIHFAGHGLIHDRRSYLLLEQPTNGSAEALSDPITVEEFAELIAHPRLSLVVLNACQTAGTLPLFTNAARAIMQRQTPAVIGMQTEVLDQSAMEFAREFYHAWAAGEAIEGALVSARRLMTEARHGVIADWSIPVLYLGPYDGLTLTMDFPAIRPPWPVRAIQWTFLSLLGLLGILGTLFTIPDLNQRIRTEIPVINCSFPLEMDRQNFNIVITPFLQADAEGRLTTGEDGYQAAADLFTLFAAQMETLPIASRIDLRPPNHTCARTGDTPEQRRVSAQTLASQIGANMVIYGVVRGSGQDRQLMPEYIYVPGRFTDTEVPVGAYPGFTPFALALPVNAADGQDLFNCLLPKLLKESSDFNVVMPPFTYAGINGNYATSQDGRRLAVNLFDRLSDLQAELKLQNYVTLGPEDVCPLQGTTLEEMDRNAADLAKRLHSNVVIYGMLFDVAPEQGQQAQLEIRFHVDYRGIEQAPELAGPYGTGTSEQVNLPVESKDFQGVIDTPMNLRMRALSNLTIGLASYVQDNFESALEYFYAARSTMNKHTGLKIAYLFLGNTYVRLASQEQNFDLVPLAEENFRNALTVDPRYARAQIGLAGTMYQEALGSLANVNIEQIDLLKLGAAEQAFQDALRMDTPPSAHIDEKVDFYLGQIELVRCRINLADGQDCGNLLTLAAERFRRITFEHERGEPGLGDLASQAHARLGLLAEATQDTQTALEEYKQAAALASPYWQIQYTIQVGDIYSRTGQLADARRTYLTAFNSARDKYEELADQVQLKLDGLP